MADKDPLIVKKTDVGYSMTTRTGARGLDSLRRRYGDSVWTGEADRESGRDPKRPWM